MDRLLIKGGKKKKQENLTEPQPRHVSYKFFEVIYKQRRV